MSFEPLVRIIIDQCFARTLMIILIKQGSLNVLSLTFSALLIQVPVLQKNNGPPLVGLVTIACHLTVEAKRQELLGDSAESRAVVQQWLEHRVTKLDGCRKEEIKTLLKVALLTEFCYTAYADPSTSTCMVYSLLGAPSFIFFCLFSLSTLKVAPQDLSFAHILFLCPPASPWCMSVCHVRAQTTGIRTDVWPYSDNGEKGFNVSDAGQREIDHQPLVF